MRVRKEVQALSRSPQMTSRFIPACGDIDSCAHAPCRGKTPISPWTAGRFCNGCLGGGAGSMSQGLRVLVLLDTIQHLEACGVDLYLDQQAIDTTTPMGKLVFQLTGAFAEFERLEILSATGTTHVTS